MCKVDILWGSLKTIIKEVSFSLSTRRAAAPTDLYAALQEALDLSNHSIPYTLNNVMNLWTNQGGFPVIEVTRTSVNAQSLQVIQVSFVYFLFIGQELDHLHNVVVLYLMQLLPYPLPLDSALRILIYLFIYMLRKQHLHNTS